MFEKLEYNLFEDRCVDISLLYDMLHIIMYKYLFNIPSFYIDIGRFLPYTYALNPIY